MSLLQKSAYPSVRRSATTYVMHQNTTVPDPYDWLEQPNAEETKSFVTEQNKVFTQAMAPFDDKKESLKKKAIGRSRFKNQSFRNFTIKLSLKMAPTCSQC